MSRWSNFERYCVGVTPILEAISRNGLGINLDTQRELFQILTHERDAIYDAIQAKIPLAVFKIKSWKRSPKVVDAEGYATITIGKKDDEKITARVKLIAYPEGGFWCRLPFNPRSWEMVQDLGAALGAKLPKKQDAESDDDTSTDDKALKRAAKKFPVFEDIRQYRKRDKLINGYAWVLDVNNRVHPVFGYHPSTWRKSCRQPNIQTIPKRSDLAKSFRKMIIAKPGNVLIEGDSCVDPKAKVLKSDLTWCNAEDIYPGDELVGFGEVLSGHSHKFEASLVVGCKRLMKPRVRIHTTIGFFDVSADHRFVSRRRSYKRRWYRADKLRPGAILPIVALPWEADNSREAGYLAGLFDGEGWVTSTKVAFAQNQGETLDNALSLLTSKGFNFAANKRKMVTHPSSNAYKYHKPNRVIAPQLSTMRESMHFLGAIRPPRLLKKSRKLWEGRRTWGRKTLSATVIKVEVIEPGQVIAIETTSKTFVSDGLMSHNCAIEAVIVGWLAGSERYIRLARAGVHGWITSALHGEHISLDISDAALTAACQRAKKEWPDDYEKCKRVVHLSNYCGTPRRIAEEYPDEFPRESDAARLQNFYFGTEAGADVKQWQRQTIEIAHANKGLENHFGLRHRFYSLYSYDSRRKCYVLGDDAKRAVAFVPQSDASFVQSDILLRLVERDSRFLGWLVAIVHDSIVLDCPWDVADYVSHTLYEEMVRPLPQLDGLWIGSEVKRGPNLADMETLKI